MSENKTCFDCVHYDYEDKVCSETKFNMSYMDNIDKYCSMFRNFENEQNQGEKSSEFGTGSKTELLPCPFCGEHGAHKNTCYLEMYYQCEVLNADIQFRVMAEAWNTRTLDLESYEAGRRDAKKEIDAACAECEAQQERELQEAQKERTCTATFILKGRPNYLLSLYACSSCGVSWHIEPSREPSYCPHCGCKVVKE